MLKLLNRFGLVFSITNIIPLSIVPVVLQNVLTFKILANFTRLDKLSCIAILYLIYIFGSGLIYGPYQFLDVSFYRYDGNSFVVFLTLVWLPLLKRQRMRTIPLKRIVIFSIILASTYALVQFGSRDHVTGFFVSVNAFTGYLMVLGCMVYAWFACAQRTVKLFYFVLFFLVLVVMIIAQARASFIGLIGAIIYYKYFSISLLRQIIFWFAVVTVFAVVLSITYPMYIQDPLAASTLAHERGEGTKSVNVLLRVYENWPRGLYYFLNSPIIGVGFGSINDIFANRGELFPTAGWVYTNSSAHAHNTFLTVMGETGIVGLALFLTMLYRLLIFINLNVKDSGLRMGLVLSFWALTIASLAEHRWVSPSNVMPFLYLVALSIGSNLPISGKVCR